MCSYIVFSLLAPAVYRASVTEAKEDKGIVFCFVLCFWVLVVLFTP